MSQKNHIKLIIILSVLFSIIFGVGLGFYINQIYNLSASPYSNKQNANSIQKEKITFLLRENRQIDSNDINKFQDVFIKALKGKNYEIVIQTLKAPASNNLVDRNKKRQDNVLEIRGANNFVTIDDTYKVVRAVKKGVNILPVLQLSPFSNEKCFTEVQFLAKKTSTLTDIEQAKFQNIVISNLGLNIASMKITEMGRKGLHFKTLFFINDVNEGISLLNSNEYASFAIRVSQSEKNTINSLLGTFTDNQYPNYPDLKQIGLTNYRIPCKVLFLKNTLRKETIDEFTDKFYKYINSPEGNKVFEKITGLKSAELISPPEWEAITSLYLDNDYTSEIEKYADKIFRKTISKPAPPKNKP